MLEGVFEVRKEARLVQELGGLKMGEAAAEVLLGRLRDRPKEGQGYVLADDGRGLEEPFVLGSKAVDPRREDRLHRGRHLNIRESLRQPVGAALAHQNAALDKRSHALLQEERVAFGPLDQRLFEIRQLGALAQQGGKELARALRAQWVDSALAVVGLAAPAMLVFGPVVDEEEQPGGG